MEEPLPVPPPTVKENTDEADMVVEDVPLTELVRPPVTVLSTDPEGVLLEVRELPCEASGEVETVGVVVRLFVIVPLLLELLLVSGVLLAEEEGVKDWLRDDVGVGLQDPTRVEVTLPDPEDVLLG